MKKNLLLFTDYSEFTNLCPLSQISGEVLKPYKLAQFSLSHTYSKACSHLTGEIWKCSCIATVRSTQSALIRHKTRAFRERSSKIWKRPVFKCDGKHFEKRSDDDDDDTITDHVISLPGVCSITNTKRPWPLCFQISLAQCLRGVLHLYRIYLVFVLRSALKKRQVKEAFSLPCTVFSYALKAKLQKSFRDAQEKYEEKPKWQK